MRMRREEEKVVCGVLRVRGREEGIVQLVKLSATVIIHYSKKKKHSDRARNGFC